MIESPHENEEIGKKCDNCNEMFSSESQLAKHFNEVHMVIMCPHCDVQFKDVSELNEHMKNNHTDFLSVSIGSQPSHNSSQWSKVYCPRCKKMFENEKDLSDHMESCHGAVFDRNTYCCELCEYNCDSSLSMNNHIDRYHRPIELNDEDNTEDISISQSPDERFPCNQCDSSFSYQFTLELHIKNNHTGNNFCYECNFRTTSDENLQKHINFFHNPMEYSSDSNASIPSRKRPIINDSSTETLISIENADISLNMKVHCDNPSKRRKPMSEFLCDTCHKSFSKKFNLQRHVKNVHGK